MSGSARMFHMAPTTFHGMSSGSAISTRQTETHGPLRGIGERDGEAERDLDDEDDGGEEDLAQKGGVEALRVQHLLEPAARPTRRRRCRRRSPGPSS